MVHQLKRADHNTLFKILLHHCVENHHRPVATTMIQYLETLAIRIASLMDAALSAMDIM